MVFKTYPQVSYLCEDLLKNNMQLDTWATSLTVLRKL